MGDPNEFYSRRHNRRHYISVVYKSGRKEVYDYGTRPAAERGVEKFKNIDTVKSAKHLKGEPRATRR